MSNLPQNDPNDQPKETKRSPINRSERWLQLCFALISCLGGLVLASGPGTEYIPIIAVFFAVFGFVFVDWLRAFALPPIAAYVAMGLAAIYCVKDFWNLRTTGSEQMIAVALLLVLVQAILMLQRKTPRIFEQLGVFCLLQLVVGAVFNDAINYGLLLIPIGIIGAWGLSLMSSVAASEGIETRSSLHARLETQSNSTSHSGETTTLLDRIANHWMFRPIASTDTSDTDLIRVWTTDSLTSLASATHRLQRFTLVTLAPAVLLVTAIFFYALPRTTDAARLNKGGSAMVGFNETVALEQFGQMLQSNETAMRINMTDRRSGKPYLVNEGFYLRGKVLENYFPDINRKNPTAKWKSIPVGPISGNQFLPSEYIPQRKSDEAFFDSVEVEVSCNSMRTRSLFAIAPYHRQGKTTEIVHATDRWTISHQQEYLDSYPSIEYQFGTNGFRDGRQLPVIARVSTLGRMMSGSFAEELRRQIESGMQLLGSDSADRLDKSAASRSRLYGDHTYLGKLTAFDPSSMPTIQQVANDVMHSIPPDQRTVITIARELQQQLAVTGGYQYTLNLNAEPIDGLDPIEQFVKQDKRGHCQYFASALVMMLRSLNIPARMVVGYRTGEYNDLGKYYIARQSHAHAWVEALIDRDQLKSNEIVYGQPQSNQYWLRLDPTPGTSTSNASSGGAVDQVFNMAETMWGKYVIGMDAGRQGEALSTPEISFISSTVQWLQNKISKVRTGNLGGGSLSAPGVPLHVGILVLVLTIGLFFLIKTPFAKWISRRLRSNPVATTDKPSIPFYAESLHQLSRIGLSRRTEQTPAEFSRDTQRQCDRHGFTGVVEPFGVLTNAFYQQRYGNEHAAADDVRTALDELRKRIDVLVTNKPPINELSDSMTTKTEQVS